MQVYWVELRGGLVGDERAGQFVHGGDDDEMVRGFVAEVDRQQERILIYLFEPRPVESFATVVHETIEDKVWEEKLAEVLRADPEVAQQWVNTPTSN